MSSLTDRLERQLRRMGMLVTSVADDGKYVSVSFPHGEKTRRISVPKVPPTGSLPLCTAKCFYESWSAWN